MTIKNPHPVHPGAVLSEIYMKEIGLTQQKLSEKTGYSPSAISRILNSKAKITPDFAISLESAIGTTAEMWVRIQADIHFNR
jgi:addiction module HigA family antidote